MSKTDGVIVNNGTVVTVVYGCSDTSKLPLQQGQTFQALSTSIGVQPGVAIAALAAKFT